MEDSSDSSTRGLRRASASFPSSRGAGNVGKIRKVVALLAAITGAIAGGILWVPLGVIAPFWIVWMLPQLFGAVYASSLAYLVAGPAKAALSRTMGISALVAAVCGAINLVVGTSPWTPPFYDILPPGGQTTVLVEALAIGVVAGLVALKGDRGERSRHWIPLSIALCVTLLTSALAITTLLYVGGTIAQELWFGPEPSVPGDRS